MAKGSRLPAASIAVCCVPTWVAFASLRSSSPTLNFFSSWLQVMYTLKSLLKSSGQSKVRSLLRDEATRADGLFSRALSSLIGGEGKDSQSTAEEFDAGDDGSYAQDLRQLVDEVRQLLQHR